ncbi:hypothetical protein KUTeg_008484 [Tegillarca granosa]|uniref:Peptidoglycan-recognition protein n=1 Tax=Tegillarca granosa TaxID=220873 RepID=A0ABQ9F982_TEGGR|nr:hypothetical protein KUTeg_008484 [Tegillarca granosa]
MVLLGSQVMIFILHLLLFVFITNSDANDCACATGDVNVRTGAGTDHAVIGVLNAGRCVEFTGHLLTIGTTTVAVNTNNEHRCPTIISRAEWGARAPNGTIGKLPPPLPKYVIIHHGATQGCHTKSDCSAMVRSYQRYHMDYHGWSDIGYSFVVGEDGNIYEARGWDEIGAHTYNYNYNGLGICIIGDFTSHIPNDAALYAVKQLIQYGLDNGHISADYILKGHRDVGKTSCPGTKLWELIHSWPHYQEH